MDLKAIVILMQMICLVFGDFFSDLDKMDVDSQLLEIDKMLNTIDTDEDEAMDKLVDDKTGDEDVDFDDALGALTNLLGGGSCTYKCKNGKKPMQRKGHKPSSNGCGSYGIQIDITDLPGAEKCCDKHDHCYDTCNSDRKVCDKAFKDCLHKICKDNKKTATLSTKDCKAGADIMYSGAATLGCQSFLDSQEKACACDASDQKTDKTNSKTTVKMDEAKEKRKDKSTIKKDHTKDKNKPKTKPTVKEDKPKGKTATSSKSQDKKKTDTKKKDAKVVNTKDEL